MSKPPKSSTESCAWSFEQFQLGVAPMRMLCQAFSQPLWGVKPLATRPEEDGPLACQEWFSTSDRLEGGEVRAEGLRGMTGAGASQLPRSVVSGTT